MSDRRRQPAREAARRAPPPPSTPHQLLEQAEALQQRAERRSVADALPALQAAVDAFRAALAAGPEAQFGLGESLQLWGDTQVELARAAPDEQLSAASLQQAAAAAQDAYRQAVSAYEQVGGASGPRPDAAVNAANALASWAELLPAGSAEQGQLLARAVELYRAAQAEEEDALTLSNLGDALVAQGEAALAAGHPQAGQAAFGAALEAYQASCALSDSAQGDDLPGLLHNWGSGLATIARHTQDAALKRSLLEQAAEKLRHSAAFARGDPAPHNALGDVLLDAAELLVSQHDQQQQQQQQQQPLPPGLAEQAAGMVKQALDDGFMAALTINRTNADALVGLAEASVAMAKLARRQGDAAGAAGHFSAALGHYRSALQRPQLLGSLSERCDVRYNAACAASMAAQPEAARELLTGLAALPGVLRAPELAADEELAGLRELPWFGQLLAGLELPPAG